MAIDHRSPTGFQISSYWRLPCTQATSDLQVRTLDLILASRQSISGSKSLSSWLCTTLETINLPKAMASKLPTAHEPESLFTAFKVILPRSKGYWVRRNIIQQRFVDAGAKSVEDFAQARQYYEPAEIENLCARSLPALLDIAVGVIELHARTCLDSVVEESAALELDVLNRLSLPLLLPEPIPRYRLAVLHGRYNFKMTEMLYRAASEMDIEIFVLAEPDHWFQSNEYAKFRKAYIPIDIQRVDDT